MSDAAFPNGYQWVSQGERFVIEHGQIVRDAVEHGARVAGEGVADAAVVVSRGVVAAAAPEVAGPLLVGGALGIAAAPEKLVSREEAQRIGAAERAAHPAIPSPFTSEAYVQSLPTQAQINAMAIPHPREGLAPSITPIETQDIAPHVRPVHEHELQRPHTSPIEHQIPERHVLPEHERGRENPHTTPIVSPQIGILEQRDYDHVDSHAKPEGAAALARFNECFPQEPNFSGKSSQAFPRLKRSIADDALPGEHADHIVTQAQTNRFGTEAIQHNGNVILEPADVHMARTAIGNRSIPEDSEFAEQGFKLRRDATASLSWEEQMRRGIQEIRAAMDERNVTPEIRERIEKQLGERERLMPEICSPKLERAGPARDVLQNSTEGNARSDAPQQPGHSAASLTVFHDGHIVTVGHGHQQSGIVHNFGRMVGIQHDKSLASGLTMYSRKELVETTPHEHRAALHNALRDGNKLEISIGHNGAGIHDKTPALEGHSQAHARAKTQERAGGHELGL